MIIVTVSYPLVTDDNLGDPHQSAKSRKRKVQDPAGVPNVVELDIQDGHAVIPMLISIPITKGMLWPCRICWMVLVYLVVGQYDVQLHLPFNCRVITLTMSSPVPLLGCFDVVVLEAPISRSLRSSVRLHSSR